MELERKQNRKKIKSNTVCCPIIVCCLFVDCELNTVTLRTESSTIILCYLLVDLNQILYAASL